MSNESLHLVGEGGELLMKYWGEWVLVDAYLTILHIYWFLKKLFQGMRIFVETKKKGKKRLKIPPSENPPLVQSIRATRMKRLQLAPVQKGTKRIAVLLKFCNFFFFFFLPLKKLKKVTKVQFTDLFSLLTNFWWNDSHCLKFQSWMKSRRRCTIWSTRNVLSSFLLNYVHLDKCIHFRST